MYYYHSRARGGSRHKAHMQGIQKEFLLQKDEDEKEVIQLSGDQRTNVKEFLVDQEICHSDAIVLHGF